ncbi:5'-deoxynucleotidase, partial [Vibrio rotiferianus]
FNNSLLAWNACLEPHMAKALDVLKSFVSLDITLQERKTPEMEYFLHTFAPSFELSLDEIS